MSLDKLILMFISKLIYKFLQEIQESLTIISWIDLILNIATAVGTIGAVGVSLYLSGEETRSRKRKEEENIKKIKSVILMSLTNTINKMERYSIIITEYKKKHPLDLGASVKYITVPNEISVALSYEAYRQISLEVQKFKDRDYEYINSQLEVIRKLDLNVLPTELIEVYYSSYTTCASLNQWFLRLKDKDTATDSIICFLDEYVSPINNVLKELKNNI